MLWLALKGHNILMMEFIPLVSNLIHTMASPERA